MPERFNVGGFPDAGRTAPYQFVPHDTPSALPPAIPEERRRRGNHNARQAAGAYMEKHPATTGMILIEHGKIVFEAYQGQGSPTAEFYSQSIGKSMTSLAVGQALCAGILKSLDLPASRIVPELGDNNYGKSTVRQLLMMSSGAYMTRLAGQPQFDGGIGRRPRNGKPFQATPWPIRLGQITIDDVLWGRGWDKIRLKNYAPPGEGFVYKAGDRLALGKVIERLTGNSLAAYFDQTVWQAVRGAGRGRWESDRTGSTVAYAGLQLQLRDWGRTAVWILKHRAQPGCFGKYLREATTTRISNARLGSRAGGLFDGYGYQWWTDNRQVPGFWGKGYAGQELGLNPETGKILIKFGYKSYPGTTTEINELYRAWNRPAGR